MRNEKLIALMNLKGMTQATLSKETHIPASTLKRIINGENQKDKMVHMESIAKALGTSVHSIFDIPLETPLAAALRPDEAGASVTKLLTSDESLLIYWFQNTYREGQAAILKRAKEEYNKTQNEILKKVTSLDKPKDNPGYFDQLSLELRT